MFHTVFLKSSTTHSFTSPLTINSECPVITNLVFCVKQTTNHLKRFFFSRSIWLYFLSVTVYSAIFKNLLAIVNRILFIFVLIEFLIVSDIVFFSPSLSPKFLKNYWVHNFSYAIYILYRFYNIFFGLLSSFWMLFL